jgi:predicted site-specific integrase-resolvase
MNLEEAKKYFKTYYRMAKVLQVTPQAIQHWIKAGYIPYLHQLNLERLTEGELMADEENVNSKFYKNRILKQKQQKGE